MVAFPNCQFHETEINSLEAIESSVAQSKGFNMFSPISLGDILPVVSIGALLIAGIGAALYFARSRRAPQSSSTDLQDLERQLRENMERFGKTKSANSEGEASSVLATIHFLRQRNADWALIYSTLNPMGDPEIQQLLVYLRGPHIFTPHVALNVLEEAANQVSPGANLTQILKAAIDSHQDFSR